MCIASLGTHHLFKLQSSTSGRAQQSRVCRFYHRKRVVRKLRKNLCCVLPYFTQISPLIDLIPFLFVLRLGSSHTIPAHATHHLSDAHNLWMTGKQPLDELQTLCAMHSSGLNPTPIFNLPALWTPQALSLLLLSKHSPRTGLSLSYTADGTLGWAGTSLHARRPWVGEQGMEALTLMGTAAR